LVGIEHVQFDLLYLSPQILAADGGMAKVAKPVETKPPLHEMLRKVLSANKICKP
jgi:hypothetical protein